MKLTDLVRDPFKGFSDEPEQPSEAYLEGHQAVIDVLTELDEGSKQ